MKVRFDAHLNAYIKQITKTSTLYDFLKLKARAVRFPFVGQNINFPEEASISILYELISLLHLHP